MHDSTSCRLLLLAFCLAMAVPVAAQELDYKGFPEWSWGKQDSSEYYLYTPSNMKAGQKYPIVLFMHGCCGQDYHATLRNAVDPPVRMWHDFGENKQRIPTYIISAKTKRGWRQHFDNLKAVIDDLIKNHQGDPQRVYVSGFSMGGGGTWEIIERYPGFFAAALPMGMDFRGHDYSHYKDLPIWANRGETDWFSRHLGKQIVGIRELNGGSADSSNWITGINPRLTTFAGVGHGVMWAATSTQDLVGWAYSKVNDGNVYPTISIASPANKDTFSKGATATLAIKASDADGTIDKVVVSSHSKVIKTLTSSPYTVSLKLLPGDNVVEATAYDNGGKTASQSITLRVPVPVLIKAERVKATAGTYLSHQLQATGNGSLSFELAANAVLPTGLVLDEDGLLYGIPVTTGNYAFDVVASDEDGDRQQASYQLSVANKLSGTVLVTNVLSYSGASFPVDRVRKGISPHSGPIHTEVTLSGGLAPYEGLTLIRTDPRDTVNAGARYLSFDVDEDVIVYVAYERRDNLFSSSTPTWLDSFEKDNKGQIVAQYFYYDVYKKRFPKGTVVLPDAEEQRNDVNRNYFVMVKKDAQ